MSTETQLRLENLPLETHFDILDQGLPIKDLRDLRGTSKELRLSVDEFVRHELIRLKTQGPSTLSDFLATQESVTSDNAWTILGLFKQTYPSLPLNLSIEKALQDLNRQLLDQATLQLKNALVLQNPGAFADLQLQQTAEQIRTWFSNPINHPRLQNVTGLNLSGRGLSLIPSELRFLSNLQWLNLSQNQIISIASEAFANLPNLQELSLDYNKISEIDPQTFANLPNLNRLFLRQNQLTAIDSQTFTNVPNLQLLNLAQNQLSVIDPQTFANLPNLQFLSLQDNQLTEIGPQTFANLPNLRSIFLHNNLITAADGINHAYLGLGPFVQLSLGLGPNVQEHLGVLRSHSIFNLGCSIL